MSPSGRGSRTPLAECTTVSCCGLGRARTSSILAFLREGIDMSLLSDWSDESCPIARGLDVLGDASMRLEGLEGLDPPVVRNDQVKAA